VMLDSILTVSEVILGYLWPLHLTVHNQELRIGTVAGAYWCRLGHRAAAGPSRLRERERSPSLSV